MRSYAGLAKGLCDELEVAKVLEASGLLMSIYDAEEEERVFDVVG